MGVGFAPDVDAPRLSFTVVFLVNAAEADLGRCLEKVLQLRNRAQLGFVHVDHHSWMINLLAIVWTTGGAMGSFLGGNTCAVQAHTSLDKAESSMGRIKIGRMRGCI